MNVYSLCYDCKSFSSNAIEVRKVYTISHVTLETVPKYANIERPTSSQLYASLYTLRVKTNLIIRPSVCVCVRMRVQSYIYILTPYGKGMNYR